MSTDQDRGLQVCDLLAQGLTLKEIAVSLGLKRTQVDWAIQKLRRRYECLTTEQLMWWLGKTAKGVKAIPTPRNRGAYLKRWKANNREHYNQWQRKYRKGKRAATTTQCGSDSGGIQPEGCDAGGEAEDAIGG